MSLFSEVWWVLLNTKIIPSIYQIILQQREKSWFASSMRSRSQYLWPSPGLPCLNEQAQTEIMVDPSIGPVDAFCLLILEPDQVLMPPSLPFIYPFSLSHIHYGYNHLQVDYLNLKSNQRLTFRSSLTAAANKSWIVERVNP